MLGASDYLEQAQAEYLFGIAAPALPANLYLALFTTHLNDAGSGTEVSGGSYARVSVTRDGTAWTRTASQIANSNTITFPVATADWGVLKSAALVDASSGGNVWWAFPYIETSRAFVGDDTSNVLYVAAHGYDNDDMVVVYNHDPATLPTGLTNQNEYYVISATTNSFQVSATQGGAAIDISGGSGQVAKTRYRQNPEGIQSIFSAGTLVINFN